MNSKLIVFGPIPPPFGGVSIHIIRFLELVKAEGLDSVGVPYTGTTRQGKLAKLVEAVKMVVKLYSNVKINANDTLHVHYGGLGYFLAIIPFLNRTKARKVITFHSVRVIQDLEGRPEWLCKLVLKTLDSFDLFVPVRNEIGTELKKFGLNGPSVIVMPAFLPPADSERDLSRLPEDIVEKIMTNQAAGRLQVCVAAYYLGPGYGKNDLYGIEELVRSLVFLDSSYPGQMDLWVLVSNRPETNEQKKAEILIQELSAGLVNINVETCYGLPLIPIMARCGAFLRPSREDGDSVAIREAMSMGLKVLASDVVNRPESVNTFTMRSAEALADDLLGFLDGAQPVPANSEKGILSEERERFQTFVRQVAGMAD